MAKALILVVLLASGCQSTGGNFCLIERPKYLTPAEIDALPDSVAADILARNEKGQALCGWKVSK